MSGERFLRYGFPCRLMKNIHRNNKNFIGQIVAYQFGRVSSRNGKEIKRIIWMYQKWTYGVGNGDSGYGISRRRGDNHYSFTFSLRPMPLCEMV